MASGDPVASEVSIGDTNKVIFDGSQSATGAIDVTEIGGTGGATVRRELDVDGDGTFETSVVIDQPTNTWHSQKNVLVVSQTEGVQLTIENTSGGSASYYIAGYEVPDGA